MTSFPNTGRLNHIYYFLSVILEVVGCGCVEFLWWQVAQEVLEKMSSYSSRGWKIRQNSVMMTVMCNGELLAANPNTPSDIPLQFLQECVQIDPQFRPWLLPLASFSIYYSLKWHCVEHSNCDFKDIWLIYPQISLSLERTSTSCQRACVCVS